MSSTDSQEIEQYLNQKGYEQVQFVDNQWWGISKGYVMPVPIPVEVLLIEQPRQSDRNNLKFRLQRKLEVCLHRIIDLILRD